jgi:hypothetical protein
MDCILCTVSIKTSVLKKRHVANEAKPTILSGGNGTLPHNKFFRRVFVIMMQQHKRDKADTE